MHRTAAVILVATATLGSAQEIPVRKQLVAHRGASAYAPEHTIEAYRLAIEQGADYVEQDLAVTKDGVLVCIHDLTLDRTTDVEQVFPDRFSEDRSSGTPVRRWLVNDFTLAEIQRLDAGSWFDAKFAGTRIPTFQEAVDAVKGKAGLYPELKDPEFYRTRGVSPEKLLAEALRKNGLIEDPKTPVIIQSFDDTTIKLLAKELPKVPRVFLVEARATAVLDSPDKLREIARWATGLGPNKGIVTNNPDIVKWAHAAGLTVTPWTFRSSNTGSFPSVRAEMEKFLYEYGVDAVFTVTPDQFPR
ncbi:MAG TPA: glycerophosphodiester phosphodiesterase family protein, partial [Vicinamibacterales bacterium]|nr:glycerophosphodiester phosphodiesterase family protein [Vicinamibacterales bacterium]